MDSEPARRPTVTTSTHTAINAYLKERRTVGAINRTTEQHMRGVLYGFASVAPREASKIRRRDVLRWLRTTTHLSAGTKRLYRVRVQGFTDHLLRKGTIHKDPFADVPRPKVPRSVHRALEDDQSAALIAACVEPREKVLVVLALHTGLRRAELAALEIGDVSLSARTVLVRCGKGGASRLLPLSEEAARTVARYVAEQGLSHGPLLRSLSQPQEGIRPGTVSRIFSELAFRSGVKVRAWDGIGPHSLRHTAATGWYQSSGDVLAVSDLLGHASLAQTQRYVKGLDVERLRAAVEQKRYLPPAAA